MSGSVLYDAPGPRAKRLDRTLNLVFSLAFVAIGAWILWSWYQRGIFDDRWAILWDPPKGQTAGDVWLSLAKGLGNTLKAAALAAPVALILGGAIAIVRRGSARRVLSGSSAVVTELARGLPVLLLMFLAKLVFGWDVLWSVVFGLVVYNAAVVAEILRAGLAALPKGQREAGLSIGLSTMRTTLLIELPQAVRIMLPALVSQLVVLLKDTSLGFIVAYPELLRTIKLNRDYFGVDYTLPLFLVGATIYILINMAVSRLATYIERRLREGGAGRGLTPPEIGPTGPIPQSGIGGPAREEGAHAGDPLFGAGRPVSSQPIPQRRPGDDEEERRRRAVLSDPTRAGMQANSRTGDSW
ncbi:amino acid ABC transporter permease [Demequina sp. SYSU T00039]|uniref:Amino acid ABC transporter permease n=1 Tax=Demequina lignilytica TaxID=3051663 RepID=A0AAW7M8P4_9MICO|nr:MULTISPECIES: amino acid ABC transporter permease [unclassified Demequina]MDN4477169.1 amino acid ABC transporter permease [Demequina sp. SYSU T00039-1]MDN4487342.1 amino acid ABC transporter permease [Demequina sp. SYSU T00039]MDN4491095.1 amino acid ABC transporter permease [Demequina sp. SYSU T00068]